MNVRKVFEDHNGVCVLPGHDVHHVVPLRLGGNNEPSNLVVLLRSDHAKAHFELYATHGDFRDLCAAYMLAGRTEEAVKQAAAAGGKAAARNRMESGGKTGFQLMESTRMLAIASKAGRVGGLLQKTRNLFMNLLKLS